MQDLFGPTEYKLKKLREISENFLVRKFVTRKKNYLCHPSVLESKEDDTEYDWAKVPPYNGDDPRHTASAGFLCWEISAQGVNKNMVRNCVRPLLWIFAGATSSLIV